jgi:hypothetical protein
VAGDRAFPKQIAQLKWRKTMFNKNFRLKAIVILIGASLPMVGNTVETVKYQTVVNNGDNIPGTNIKFNSYNQPSVNVNGSVVIRARGKGGQGQGEPIRGIYSRSMKGTTGPMRKRADTGTLVPYPNNTGATFNETPSFPRIDRSSETIAYRGMSKPVWQYTPIGGDETKIGTTGVFMAPSTTLITGANQLGVVPGFEYFRVPGEAETLKFDMFPGAPSPVGSIVAFKGNYTVTEPTYAGPHDTSTKTGVYFRNAGTASGIVGGGGGISTSPVMLVANTDTLIPNGDGVIRFGSTAPPSAAGNSMVFAGFDNEDNPTIGGIYIAPMVANPAIKTLVGINEQVPGEPVGSTFNKLSEGVSFNSRFIGFWGAWGPEMKQVTLVCPEDGNKDLIAYCLEHDNNKVVDVPVNQGIFVKDVVTGDFKMVARTLRDGFEDFVYWNYSGRPPGAGEGEEEDSEPPRWRSSSFVAVDSVVNKPTVFQAAFKGTKQLLLASTNTVQGIYMALGPNPSLDTHTTVVETGMLAGLVDPETVPLGTVDDPLRVTSVGIERDGLRGVFLAFNASMANSDASVSWAGVYTESASSSGGGGGGPSPVVRP